MGYLVLALYGLLAAAPPLCSALLIRHAARGTRPAPEGSLAVYAGALAWMLLLVAKAAIVESWRPYIFLPVPLGAALAAAWSARASPERSRRSLLGGAAGFCLLGFMLWIQVGGGYFDRLFQVAHAERALAARGIPAGDAPALVAALGSEQVFVRFGAAIALRRLQGSAAPAAPALVAALDDPDARVRAEVLRALSATGPLPPEAAAPLAEHLPHDEHADMAIGRLGEMGPRAADALPVLLRQLEDPALPVRERALRVIVRIGAPARERAAGELARIAKGEPDAKLRQDFARALKELGIPDPS